MKGISAMYPDAMYPDRVHSMYQIPAKQRTLLLGHSQRKEKLKDLEYKLVNQFKWQN